METHSYSITPVKVLNVMEGSVYLHLQMVVPLDLEVMQGLVMDQVVVVILVVERGAIRLKLSPQAVVGLLLLLVTLDAPLINLIQNLLFHNTQLQQDQEKHQK